MTLDEMLNEYALDEKDLKDYMDGTPAVFITRSVTIADWYNCNSNNKVIAIEEINKHLTAQNVSKDDEHLSQFIGEEGAFMFVCTLKLHGGKWFRTIPDNDMAELIGDCKIILVNDVIIDWLYRKSLAKTSDEEYKEVMDYIMSTKEDSHYNTDGLQPIQYSQQELSREQFEGAMLFTINKYISRFGKKKGALKLDEARKILNYAKALYSHEQGETVDPKKDFV